MQLIVDLLRECLKRIKKRLYCHQCTTHGIVYSNNCKLLAAINLNQGLVNQHWYGALGKFLTKTAGNFSSIFLLRCHEFHQIILDTPAQTRDIRIKLLCSMPCVCFEAWLLCHGYQMRQHLVVMLTGHLVSTLASWQTLSIHQQ